MTAEDERVIKQEAPSKFSRWLAVPLMLGLSACSWIKMPKVSMPSLPKVKIPFVGDDRTAPSDDPVVSWSLRQPLSGGHTLHIAAYAGQRSPAKIFSGAIMVDGDGKVDLGGYGKVKLAGMDATQAVLALEAAFRKKRGESMINVQLENIEGRPLLQVQGAVKHPGVIQFFDGSDPRNILPYVGGHDAKLQGRALHVTRKGVRKFYADYQTADVAFEEGDIVNFSDEL